MQNDVEKKKRKDYNKGNINVSESIETRKELIRINLWLGKYRILSVLHSSSVQSTVFLAEQVRSQEACVIKKIRKDNPFFPNLQKEVFFLRYLKSEFLPRLYDVEEDGDALYIIEEYIEGFTLATDNLRRERLSEKEIYNILLQFVTFLDFLQNRERPILYLDWKPENMIVSDQKLKIIDFGSALFEEEKDSLPLLATEGYSAPELSKGKGLGTFTDVYGFGCILKHFAGFLEDKGGIFRKSRKERLLGIANHCCKALPEERWSLGQIHKALRALNPGVKDLTLREDSLYSLGINTRTIGIMGLFHGVGVSHVATLIAKELSKRGGEVAFVDYGKKTGENDFLLALSKHSKCLKVFEAKNRMDLIPILNSHFRYIIIDFGIFRENGLEELLRCDKKIIVMQYSKLRIVSELRLLETMKPSFLNGNTELILNLAEEGERYQVGKEMKKRDLGWKIREQGFQKLKL